MDSIYEMLQLTEEQILKIAGLDAGVGTPHRLRKFLVRRDDVEVSLD